ncbi:MAG TPA: hypothetical protein VHC50_00960, partial [Puia sp.]|nr:hypothetical protein [Puia sp.]
MKRIFLLALLFPAVGVAQYDQVQIKWNKLALFPGAQAKFFAAVVAKDGYPSTSLYMQLYADSGGAPLNTWKWRADSGCAAGSFPAPQKPGFYWVRSYSAGSDMVVFSLRVRPKNPTYTIRRFSDSLHGKFLEHQAVWLSRDAGGYYLLNTGLDVRYFGVSVSDTGSYSPPQTWAVQRRTGDYRRDTGYLRMRFRAFAKTPVARQQIVYSIPADSNYGGPDVRRLDTAGEAVFTHITFEDSALIFYMRNHSDEEIGLAQVKEMDTLPRFTIPGGYVL